MRPTKVIEDYINEYVDEDSKAFIRNKKREIAILLGGEKVNKVTIKNETKPRWCIII